MPNAILEKPWMLSKDSSDIIEGLILTLWLDYPLHEIFAWFKDPLGVGAMGGLIQKGVY